MAHTRILIILFLLGSGLRLGYGLLSDRSVITTTGDSFILLWDYDALEHVLIARGLMRGKGYIVDDEGLDLRDKHPRLRGGPALFKAPLYQYLLAAIFSTSGFSFWVFFPAQVLLGGLLSAVVADVSFRVFKNSAAALFAGAAAATHPTLVNSASQPYNENLFFFLLFLSIWVFFRWIERPTWSSAVWFPLLAGLATLTRESAFVPFLVLVAFGVFHQWRKPPRKAIGIAMLWIAVAVATIVPWAFYTKRSFGVILPVSSIAGTSIGIGNNECVAMENAFVPYDAEIACPQLDIKRGALLADMPKEPSAVWNDKAYGILGRQYVLDNPGKYLSLSFRRAWTTFMPIHPRQNLVGIKRLVVLAYFFVVVLSGLLFVTVGLVKGLSFEAKALLAVATMSYIPLILIYVSADARYRIGIDLILGCFSGYGLMNLVSVFAKRRPDN